MKFTGASFINDCLLHPMLQINHLLLQFADITDPLLSTAAFFSRFYCHRIQTWANKVASYLTRWILRSRMQYAIEIISNSIFKFHKVMWKHLRWGGESLWHTCLKFPQESDSERILYISLHLTKLWSKSSVFLFFWLTLY